MSLKEHTVKSYDKDLQSIAGTLDEMLDLVLISIDMVAEMIGLFPVAAVYVITDLVARRYAGEQVDDINSWKIVLCLSIALMVARRVEQFFG